MRRKPFYLLILFSVLMFWQSCAPSTAVLTTGYDAFERKQYALAADLYIEEYRKKPDAKTAAESAYWAGISLQRANKASEAHEWFAKAYEAGFGPTALREQAYALKYIERYDEAARLFQLLAEKTVDNSRFKREVRACQTAQRWKTEQSYIKLNKLFFNTEYSEYAPFPIGEDIVLFTSDRPRAKGAEEYGWTGNYFSDIYRTEITEQALELYDQPINNKYNEGTVALSPDGNEIAFSRCELRENQESHCSLFLSRRTELDSWSKPERLPFQDMQANYSYPCWNSEGTVLLYSSDAEGAIGGYDLFFVERNEKGEWSAPQNLSSVINTEYDEISPFIYEDTLYFASDGHLGMGGKDIFKTYLNSKDQWTAPDNLQAPLNSGGDDFSYVRTKANKGYMTSNRQSGGGSDDIYAWIVERPDIVVDNEDEAEEGPKVEKKKEYLISVYVKTPEYEDRKDPNSATGRYVGLKNALVTFSAEREVAKPTNPVGVVTHEGELDQIYKIQGRKPGFFTQSITFEPQRDSIEDGEIVNLVLTMDRIFPGREIVLENIYYDLDKWAIRDDARPTLDSLSRLLKANPDIRIEMGSHTDCRGGVEYNQDLSQKRAQSAIEYLEETGISRDRLEAVGYGESRLKIDCPCESCTEAQHQQNRRTSFTVLE